MKPIRLSQHAQEQAKERGATETEVKEAVRKGSREPAARGREICRYNFVVRAQMATQTLCDQTGRTRNQRAER